MIVQHDSDCATHNMPAYQSGPCNCTLSESEVKSEPIKRGPFESLAEFQGKHRFKTSEPMQHYQRRASDIKVGDL